MAWLFERHLADGQGDREVAEKLDVHPNMVNSTLRRLVRAIWRSQVNPEYAATRRRAVARARAKWRVV